MPEESNAQLRCELLPGAPCSSRELGSPLGLGAVRNWVGRGPAACARSRYTQGGVREIRSRINLF